MILKSAAIRNYKCFYDSGEVPLESDITCFVGKNESGKTAFMESLYRLNPLPSGHRMIFDELLDYPRRRRGTGGLRHGDQAPIEATLEVSEEDVTALQQVFGPGVLKSRLVKLGRTYGSALQVKADVNEQAFVHYLLVYRDLQITPSPQLNSVERLREVLQQMPRRTPTGEKLLQNLTGFDLQTQVGQQITARLPRFLYFDEFSALPTRFSIPYILQTPAQKLSKSENAALALLRLAGIDRTTLTEAEYEARKALLEAAAMEITDEVFQFWSQNSKLRVDFDIDYSASSDARYPPPFLDIRIWNEEERMSLRFGERSKGFIWFFSFLVYFAELRRRAENVVLLLDEPGLGLHPTAQADLLRFIEERLASKYQLVYTTHSPFMINIGKLNRVRAITAGREEGAKISSTVHEANHDALMPVRAALGHQLADNMDFGPDTLIVENPWDVLYLQVMSAHLHAQGRAGLDPRLALIPSGGLQNLPAYTGLVKKDDKPVVLANTNGSQKDVVQQMIERDILNADKVVRVAEVLGRQEAALEDMFDPGFYLTLLRGSGAADVPIETLPPGQTILQRVRQYSGKDVDRYKPALHLLRQQSLLLSGVNGATMERFELLFRNINKRLNYAPQPLAEAQQAQREQRAN